MKTLARPGSRQPGFFKLFEKIEIFEIIEENKDKYFKNFNFFQKFTSKGKIIEIFVKIKTLARPGRRQPGLLKKN